MEERRHPAFRPLIVAAAPCRSSEIKVLVRFLPSFPQANQPSMKSVTPASPRSIPYESARGGGGIDGPVLPALVGVASLWSFFLNGFSQSIFLAGMLLPPVCPIFCPMRFE